MSTLSSPIGNQINPNRVKCFACDTYFRGRAALDKHLPTHGKIQVKS